MGISKPKKKSKKPLPPKRIRRNLFFATDSCLQNPKWRVLPDRVCDTLHFWLDTVQGTTYEAKRRNLVKEIAKQEAILQHKSVVPFWTVPIALGDRFRLEYIAKAKKLLDLLLQNEQIRWKLRFFFTKIRIRRFARLNDTDPITLEPIKSAILIHSFQTRKTFVFESQSLSKHIHRQLLNHDGQIPRPSFPKNPLTNESFSLSQMIGILEQCKTFGHSSWAIEAFRACHYFLVSFRRLYVKSLRLHAFTNTLCNVLDFEAIDIVFDFIQSQHIDHGLPFQEQLYRWALRFIPYHDHIQKWRYVCKKWYEADIVVEDPGRKQDILRDLSNKTFLLCRTPKDMKDLRASVLKLTSVEDGGSSSDNSES